ncbi:ureidoglycolate lyase [Amylibacter sp. IMCC11727]|uniref:ureidoglycolate lyase n=1 Tax=Amylibacter sp. IMCC11727 TaxID=3039851 RepID=UPI00244DBCEF|nr:ureidoglycolate lyase [Amylibacter sp. IMCC11727]WGI21826.1 ureidoglycolate lyase [Amylibacter sp. IMCC11727]
MTIFTEPLTADAFAPFGDVLAADSVNPKTINQGKCKRHHDLANLDLSNGRAGVSIFKAEPRELPYTLDLVERHPDGAQTFIPMSEHPFLIIVASDDNGTPTNIRAFVSNGAQAINFHRNTWHGVLTPLHAPGLFAVVDRIGTGPNLEEHWLETPLRIEEPSL